ncbi:hypothetical protein AVEN_239211-1 [Araneus ventricosus]|uniref:Uncharacterized protein n=1 Tax=Araneus ventricosus TaxID=182803 RepID=A0A4Y2V179_ARAVE|nr:hypothetical protein AVEN_239211-1 [Araneus ventricosus]
MLCFGTWFLWFDLCYTYLLTFLDRRNYGASRGGEPSPLPPEFSESMEISDDEPTRCQRLRRNAPITGKKSRMPDS